jgi:hypothetical protein
MPIMIEGKGTATRAVFQGETLPTSTRVPSKREAVEALGIIQRLTTTHDHAVLVDGEPITWEAAVETLRRYILTR